MKNVIIFGAGGMGNDIYREICEEVNVVAFWDNGNRVGDKINGIIIEKPNVGREADSIILGACYPSMKTQLVEMGIPETKIDEQYVSRRISARINFLKNYSKIVYKGNLEGNVAEAGVFQGEFAKHINKYFPDRELYLFDTFEGFDERDVSEEQKNQYSGAQIGQYAMTTEEAVLEKMLYPSKCKIFKGFFPETALNGGISDVFCFVNLDMDLYRPTLEGLRFFHDKMVKNGVILVHDYFSHYKGVEQAVSEFLEEYPQYQMIPIGDEISMAIVGFGM